jgi:phosphoribosylformylglycinamidine synthase subunit PurSL
MIFRIDVTNSETLDPTGEGVRKQIAELGKSVGPIRTYRIFYLDGDFDMAGAERVARELLADPVVEQAQIVQDAPTLTLPRRTGRGEQNEPGHSRIEVHLKPGVMDPVAASTEMAIRDLGLEIRQVRTGRAYVIDGVVPREDLQLIANRILANSVIEHICFEPLLVKEFPQAHEQPTQVRHVALRNLADEQLIRLSREGHLFLSLTEMQAIQKHYCDLGREPTDVELETLAQTWSEHCVHKTLKSAVDLEIRDESGKTIATRRYGNLIKETIFRSTKELMEEETKRRRDGETRRGRDEETERRRDKEAVGGDFCLSVFVDNAGVIAFDETDAVCFKVETHNRPSAIDPYGGSATGSGGVIRDVLGTGLAAKPIANTDVFCVAHPATANLPKGVIHPKRILREVVAGVRDYGNRMGIPTLNGAVYFDDRYLGNPLVFCGCVGLIPRGRIHKEAKPGDRIVVVGGRTGRDGIHGATFSSAQLTTSHADEFSHAVQIGNAITEKKMTDVILQAADRGLFNAITDCGAGGLSSAVGEMGEKLGATVELDKVPLKYAGLRYDEIWISEAQERMVVAVPPEKVEELLKLAAGEDVEATVIGEFGSQSEEATKRRSDEGERPKGGIYPTLRLMFNGLEVARMDMDFIHNGIPMSTRKAVFIQKKAPDRNAAAAPPAGKPLAEQLLAVLANPNVASKHWIIRQYDHEVQGGSVIKPLLGPAQIGPSDAAVIRPKLTGHRGVVLSCGLAPHIEDPYDMAIAAIDEAIRNAVAVGADPDKLAILDNFCWPGTHDELSMGSLARTCEACHDAAKAYGVPFISGKDSLHNQFTNQETGEVIRIPNTLLVSAMGVIEDVRKCVTMDLKSAGNLLVLVNCHNAHDLTSLSRTHRAVAGLIHDGLVRSCHDVSDGGWLTAVAEMCLASGLGAEIKPSADGFAERNGAYVLEIHPSAQAAFEKALAGAADVRVLGQVTTSANLVIGESVFIGRLRQAWLGTLDW